MLIKQRPELDSVFGSGWCPFLFGKSGKKILEGLTSRKT